MSHHDRARREIDLDEDDDDVGLDSGDESWVQRKLHRHQRKVELTKLTGSGDEREEFPCPACGAAGQIDIREGTSGRCYLSCPSCFKMWQEVRDPIPSPATTWIGH